MNYNERDLKSKIETVVDTELFDLTKLFRKQFSQLTDDKIVKLKLHDHCVCNNLAVTTQSIIIDDGCGYICIDPKCNKFDIASFDFSLTKLAILSNTLAFAVDTMANTKEVKYLDNDFSDYYSEKQLLVELAFDVVKRDSLLWYYLNYDLKVSNSTGQLEITKHKVRESGNAGELILRIDSGLCFLKKEQMETTVLINLILNSQMMGCHH